ncbi:SSI family serine proteinase inhibitor [Streptomyces sp. NPDC056361]|uniref:SSI family serine proteinase inhibitor n=1 Tax=Streptomyces sp. NPDC056361 TaxID=3345795 RepID=UPI0035D69099
MNKIIPALAAAFLAAGVAPAATAVTSPAAEDTHLQLTAARTQGEARGVDYVWLDCPVGNRTAHPYRAEACAALDEAGGDFDRLRGEPDGNCTADYAPVTLTARGTYRGRTVDWTRTYGNNCEATIKTGPVFYF